jgi:hypothetical protein
MAQSTALLTALLTATKLGLRMVRLWVPRWAKQSGWPMVQLKEPQ